MGAKLGSVTTLAGMGIGALSPACGTARFLRHVEHPPELRQGVVAAHLDGLATWPAATAVPSPTLRFLDGPRTGVAGVEFRVSVALHPDRDVYLNDHSFGGSLLFPTVFGLEAMAQAAQVAWAVPGVAAQSFMSAAGMSETGGIPWAVQQRAAVTGFTPMARHARTG